jgi:hypothetical protein
MNMQVRKIGKKIIPNEDSKEDEVVNDAFEIVRKPDDRLDISELEIEVFPHE